MKRKWIAATAIALGCAAGGAFYLLQHTHMGPIVVANMLMGDIGEPRILPLPAVGDWRPAGNRHPAPAGMEGAPAGGWRERHGDGRNSDEILIAGAPTFNAARIIAPHDLYFSAVSFDKASNIYAAPSLSADGTLLQSYDIETGTLRWRIATEGSVPAGGVPIVLEFDGVETVYQMSHDEVIALTIDGEILWRKPTGLPQGESDIRLMWGPSYNPKLDIVTGISGHGDFVAFDRSTGTLLTPNTQRLPGAASATREAGLPPVLLEQMAGKLSAILNRTITATQIEQVFRVVQGDGINIANYHSIDPATGRMWISATAPDEADGSADGVSEFGALYGVDVERLPSGQIGISVGCAAYFDGGSASTPGVSADGERIYVADGLRHLLAYDRDCRKLWSIDTDAQIVASPSVAADNGEIYVITATSLLKIVDEGASAAVRWSAKFDMYEAGFPLAQKNLLTAAIAANGIYAQAGVGVMTMPGSERPGFLPLRRGGARIDRETGDLLWYAESTGDSVAVTEIAPNGALVIPQSPLRSVLAALAFPAQAGELTGGIAVFDVADHMLLARDAACAAASYGERARAEKDALSESYLEHMDLLVAQARQAASRAGGEAERIAGGLRAGGVAEACAALSRKTASR
ncbi:MAG: PQQ-binding-like beta-propeller repeat protein [Parvibaculum sp.]|nr:PQQ-binding-like beta-propeller repeat protein [Parvibaculum sp.]